MKRINLFGFEDFTCTCGESHKMSFYAQTLLLKEGEVNFTCDCKQDISIKSYTGVSDKLGSRSHSQF